MHFGTSYNDIRIRNTFNYNMIRNGIIRHQKNFLCVDKNREWYDMICKLYSVSVGGNA